MSDERTGYRSGDPNFQGGFPVEGEISDGNAAGTPEFICDLCGALMLNRHCKLACPQCGYLRIPDPPRSYDPKAHCTYHPIRASPQR